VKRVLVVLLAVLMSAAPAYAQPGKEFVAAVQSYRADPDQGLKTFLRDRRMDIADGARFCLRVCATRERLAAAMLLADAANASIVPDHERARDYVRVALFILRDPVDQTWGPPGPHSRSRALVETFIPAWVDYTARMFFSHNDFVAACSTVREGFAQMETLLPGVASATLHVTRGVIVETPIRSLPLTSGRSFDTSARFPSSGVGVCGYGNTADWIPRATADYLRALAIDAAHPHANLRLAWLRIMTGESGRAPQSIEQALHNATDDDTRYLAHLLKAGLAEKDGRVAEAVSAYQQASTLGPRYQSACTGLSRALTASGDFAAASQTAVACMAIAQDDEHPDPWLTLRFGITDTPTIEWLRAEVRK
jgi:tetratricopeptide (TPR) repeat protein